MWSKVQLMQGQFIGTRRRRLDRRLTWLAAMSATLVVVGCSPESAPRGVPATAEQCRAYELKLAGLGAPEPKDNSGGVNPLLGQRCLKRGVTADFAACVLGASTLEEILQCRSAEDRRPEEQRPTSVECSELVRHSYDLVTPVLPTLPREQRPEQVQVQQMECERWETRDHLRCQMAVTAIRDLDRCGL